MDRPVRQSTRKVADAHDTQRDRSNDNRLVCQVSMRFLASMSLRSLEPWQYSLAHLLVTVTLVSAFLSSLMSRSVVGVLVFGGAGGIGLIAVGRHYANCAAMVVGVCFTLMTVAVFLVGYCCVNIGTGFPTIPITFEVCDAQTGLPIAGARVRIRNLASYDWGSGPPGSTIPVGEDGAESTTGQDGRAKVAYHFTASTREAYFTYDAQVSVRGHLYLTVVAPGYTPATRPLGDYTGSYIENKLDGSNLAHVRIALEPNAEPARGNACSSGSAEGIAIPSKDNQDD